MFKKIGEKRTKEKVTTADKEQATAATGQDSAIYEHLHTNNKPRRQTNPLTTRCDMTKKVGGSPLCHCRGRRATAANSMYTLKSLL